jgi:hypothetical protein
MGSPAKPRINPVLSLRLGGFAPLRENIGRLAIRNVLSGAAY